MPSMENIATKTCRVYECVVLTLRFDSVHVPGDGMPHTDCDHVTGPIQSTASTDDPLSIAVTSALFRTTESIRDVWTRFTL